MKKLLILFTYLILIFALTACGGNSCQHRDADDNSLCDKCGVSYTDGKDLPGEHTHEYNQQSTNSQYLATAADCENAAAFFYSCTCGDKGTTTFAYGEPNGHSFVVEKVDIYYQHAPATEYSAAIYYKSCACGKASTTETFTHGDILPGYLTYELSYDGSFYIVTGFVGAEENITIPHINDALPVLGIEANAFKDNTTLKSITMPNSIREIGTYAFSGCAALESVSIPTSVTSIAEYTFSGCTSLKTITLNEGLETISNNAFDNCSALESIFLPDTVTNLGNMAFRDNVSLKSVKFSKGLTSIGNATFNNCVKLESVELHENITTLGNSTFANCKGLKTLRILGDITSMGLSTFYDCRALESIYFASKTPGNLGNANYIFYNAGINADGITLTVAKDAVIPEGLFTPCLKDNSPKITKISVEEDSTAFKSFQIYDYLPYLIEIEIPETVLDINYGIFNNSLWWNELEEGAVYINRIFYGIKGEAPEVLEITPNTLCIANGALIGRDNIVELIIPNGVTNIGFGAFYNCSSLESITMPFVGNTLNGTTNTHFGYIFGASSYSYNDDYVPSSLKSVTILGGSSIGSHAFRNCTSLMSVTIPDSVTNIGSYAFYNCSSLESITIPFVGNTLNGTTNTHFGYIFGASDYSYNDDYVPSSLKSVTISGASSIGSYAFYNCTSLTNVTIPDSVTIISSFAFEYCTSLGEIKVSSKNTKFQSIDGNLYSKDRKSLIQYAIGKTDTTFTIPDGVTSIESYAFYCCKSLTSVTIPNSVTSIGSHAFRKCTSLMSVTIPDSVTNIGSYAFYNCSSLESITIPFVGNTLNGTTNTHFGYIFGASSYSYNDDYVPSSLKSVTISGGSSIGSYAFRDCTSLTNVTIGNSVTSIGEDAFSECTSLTSVTIPDSVNNIGDYAFRYCTSLTNVTIGNSVTSIGKSAFRNCTSLTSIKYRGTQSQWRNISKGSSWNTSTGSYTITYNYTGN